MPCNSDHLQPTSRERYNQRTARLYRYVLRVLGRLVPRVVDVAAENSYCREDYTQKLCGTLTKLPFKKRDAVLYSARDSCSRDLADWWEDHWKADVQRRVREAKEKKREHIRKRALAKLTAEERKVLGL